MKLQVMENVQNLALYLVQALYKFLKSFKVCSRYKKIAEQRSRAGFPKLCAAAHWRAVKEIEVCREIFMF